MGWLGSEVDMICSELMKKDIHCLSPKDTALDAARKMRDGNIGFLPVCDSDGRIQGTLTDRDVTIRLVADDRSTSTPVEDIMTREIVCCRADDDIREAERLMIERQKSRMMCVDENGRLVGVISLSDVVREEDDDRAARALRGVARREAA